MLCTFVFYFYLRVCIVCFFTMSEIEWQFVSYVRKGIWENMAILQYESFVLGKWYPWEGKNNFILSGLSL